MRHYIIRLDDASEHMNLANWVKIKSILNKYEVNPIYGIIPNNRDPELLKYDYVDGFWDLMRKWQAEGWEPALHGYSHVFEMNYGGLNPVNPRSEFAGLTYEIQENRIKEGYSILKEQGIDVRVFFAPGHTYDRETLNALLAVTPIRIISDTVAYDSYYEKPFYFIPVQSGKVRYIPFRTVTFCYHPNTMEERDYTELAQFLSQNSNRFGIVDQVLNSRRRNNMDKLISKAYFIRRNCLSFFSRGRM